MSTVITVENLGKKYTISHQHREEYSSLRDVITNGVISLSKRIFSPFTPHPSPFSTSEGFWALKDVSFEVKQGDRIGIIGRNGAGKSTLLKILSRITEPTTGSVRIKGRVASLLEVGTGFHPELTGRENIFLNGAILGMGRAEIKKKFDEIVDFAEIEKFLDTPVKRYSSGMYVRLAFAVAAHMEPEILIVDEVLAVGDVHFQKKCLGKMDDVSRKDGRTVLFVSHNLGAIATLCEEVIYLCSGAFVTKGDCNTVIQSYLTSNRHKDYSNMSVFNAGDDVAILKTVQIVDDEMNGVGTLAVNDRFGIRFDFTVLKEGFNPQPCFLLSTLEGQKLFQSVCTQNFSRIGEYTSVVWIPANFLNDNDYVVTSALTTPMPTQVHVSVDLTITVIDNINAPTRGSYKGIMHGMLRPLLEWRRI